ncbi:MAG: hypothetical protein QW318_07940 [Candidatus Caldarchaeum sp.]
MKNFLPTGESPPPWLAWDKDVDVVISPLDEGTEQRFYYTGDGFPKVSTYSKATTGSPPYPSFLGWFRLGLPLPTGTITATPTPFTSVDVASVTRDASNTTTLVTSTPHGLRSGALISVTGFTFIAGTYSQSGSTITVTITDHKLVTGGQVFLRFTSGTAIDGIYQVTVVNSNTFTVTSTESLTTSGGVHLDVSDFNVSAVVATVVNSTTLQYINPGAETLTRTVSGAKITLAGIITARSYVYTWVNPWGEESIASEPSAPVFVREGQTVTLTGIPTLPPSGQWYVRGVRIYRTVSSFNDADYLAVETLWFPNIIAKVARQGSVATITTKEPHMLIIGDIVKITGCSEASFNGTGLEVIQVNNRFSFSVTQAGPSLPETSVLTGTVFMGTRENKSEPVFYWQDTTSSFVDTYKTQSLTKILDTDDYDMPPENLSGIKIINNNIMVGFVNNTLYFSEPAKYHAWPRSYARNLEHNIVALAPLAGYLLVLTDGYPYLVSGNDPRNMSLAKIDALYPCVSKQSVVNMGYGIMYATNYGLALYSLSSGISLATDAAHDNDTWNTELNPRTIKAVEYRGLYIASTDNKGFVFERTEQSGGYIIDTNLVFDSVWYDCVDNKLFYTKDGQSTVWQWDKNGQPPVSFTWKSKLFMIPKYTNFGAFRIISKFENGPINFKLYRDYQLIQEQTINSTRAFRTPLGYLSDTYEIEISGKSAVKAVHISDTPEGLKQA